MWLFSSFISERLDFFCSFTQLISKTFKSSSSRRRRRVSCTRQLGFFWDISWRIKARLFVDGYQELTLRLTQMEKKEKKERDEHVGQLTFFSTNEEGDESSKKTKQYKSLVWMAFSSFKIRTTILIDNCVSVAVKIKALGGGVGKGLVELGSGRSFHSKSTQIQPF